MFYRLAVLILTLLMFFPSTGSADFVGMDKAHMVAKNWLSHCVSAYGSWSGVSSPTILGEETLMHGNTVVGYNFLIYPKGNILVAARDDMPPVKLYSDTSTFSVYTDNTKDISNWIAEEISQTGSAIDAHIADPTKKTALLQENNPDVKAWKVFSNEHQFDREYRQYTTETEMLSLGPLMTSAWNQPDPYNQQCPLDSKGCRTVVGCVATAVSQIMKFWKHPYTGSGVISYEWNNGAGSVTLGCDFSSSTYDWANMPDSLDSASTDAQKAAVAKLCADAGIASRMNYGCVESGTAIVADIFKKYFRYKNTAAYIERSNYSSLSAWMQVFKNEVQNGRPSELGLAFANSNPGGHAVVVDGYRDTPSETVHINMGWGGSYDAWYNPDSFITGEDNWKNDEAVIGIQPDTSSVPIIKANGLHGNVTAPSTKPVSIEIGLYAGSDSGKLADLWLIRHSSTGYSSWVSPTGWISGIKSAGQFKLQDIPMAEIDKSTLPIGKHIFYFVVDDGSSGGIIPDAPTEIKSLHSDSATVQVIEGNTF